jgi:hypothetical protein
VRLLAFRILHRDQRRPVGGATRRARDVAAAVGDLASMHRGPDDMIETVRTIDRPVPLVSGNSETDDALRDACAGWLNATVLHGEAGRRQGGDVLGLGRAIPTSLGRPLGPPAWGRGSARRRGRADLEGYGAPDTCPVLGGSGDIDGKQLALHNALVNVVGTSVGTLVI